MCHLQLSLEPRHVVTPELGLGSGPIQLGEVREGHDGDGDRRSKTVSDYLRVITSH